MSWGAPGTIIQHQLELGTLNIQGRGPTHANGVPADASRPGGRVWAKTSWVQARPTAATAKNGCVVADLNSPQKGDHTRHQRKAMIAHVVIEALIRGVETVTQGCWARLEGLKWCGQGATEVQWAANRHTKRTDALDAVPAANHEDTRLIVAFENLSVAQCADPTP